MSVGHSNPILLKRCSSSYPVFEIFGQVLYWLISVRSHILKSNFSGFNFVDHSCCTTGWYRAESMVYCWVHMIRYFSAWSFLTLSRFAAISMCEVVPTIWWLVCHIQSSILLQCRVWIWCISSLIILLNTTSTKPPKRVFWTDGVLPQPSNLYNSIGCKRHGKRNVIPRPSVQGWY